MKKDRSFSQGAVQEIIKFLNMALINGLLQWIFTTVVCSIVFFVTLYAKPDVIYSAIALAGIFTAGHLIFFLKRK